MPRPSGPPLLVACYDNKIADVRALLASGADPRAAPSHDEQKFGSSLERTSPSLSSCIFSCIHFGYFEVLEVLLATGQYDLVHEVQNTMTSSHSSSRGRVAARCRPCRLRFFLSTRSLTTRSVRCSRVTTRSTRRSRSSGGQSRGSSAHARHRLSFTQFRLTPRSARRGPCPGA